MSHAPIAPPRRISAPGVSDARPGASRLLDLIGRIIEVGRERLLRGMLLAKLLEERITANAARIDAPASYRMAAPRIASCGPRKRKLSDAEDAAILHHNGIIAMIQLGAMPRVTDAYQEIRAGLVPDPITLSKPEQAGAATDPPPLLQAA